MKQVEDDILIGLTKNENIADILEDDELIHILEAATATAEDIKIRQDESKITEVEIDKTREIYRPVAYRAAVLFFTIIDLSAIDPMYQYSLQWFSGLFGSSIDNSPKSKQNIAEERIEFLN